MEYKTITLAKLSYSCVRRRRGLDPQPILELHRQRTIYFIRGGQVHALPSLNMLAEIRLLYFQEIIAVTMLIRYHVATDGTCDRLKLRSP